MMSEGKWHKKVREQIMEFLKDKGYNPKSSSPKKGTIPLYVRNSVDWRKSDESQLSDADIVVPDNDGLKYIIEIENSTQPKHIFDVVSATNSANYCVLKEGEFEIKDVFLFVVVKYKVENQNN